MLYACSSKFPNRNHAREYASEFADGESWGYRKFYELSRLHDDGFIKDDTLILRFSVRAATYYQKFRDQTQYLDKIVKERDALKQQLESAKEQISSLKTEYKSKLAEQRRVASSHTQQDLSHQSPLTMPATAAPMSSPTAAHRRHQQHSTHQRRVKTSRLKPEDTRSLAFIPISQHHSPTHATPRTMHAHHSPKRSARYPLGPHGAGEGRMVSSGEAYHSHTHLYPSRRGSNEDMPEVWKHISEQRRKSADSTVPQEQVPRAHGRKTEQPQRSLSQHVPTARRREGPRMRDSSSSEDLETGCSQQGGGDEGVVNPTDITITLQDDEGERVQSNTSSSSTLIDTGSPPRDIRSPASQHKPLSQEPFGDEDHKDMMSLSAVGPAPVPLSNFPLYYEPSGYFGDYQEHYTAPPPQPILSQPTYPSPPKSRHGKSLTDLTGSNISLTSSQQFLSVSAVDIQNMQELHHSSRQATESRRGGAQDIRYRGSRGQLHRMASDSHLNKSYTPGLQKSVIFALSEVKEEVEQKKHQSREAVPSSRGHSSQQQQQRGSRHTTQSQHAPRKGSQLQQTHLQATKVKGGSSTQERKVASAIKKENTTSQQRRPQDTPDRNKEREKKISPVTPSSSKKREEVKESSPHMSARHLACKMKSNSTSSLNNLSQIL